MGQRNEIMTQDRKIIYIRIYFFQSNKHYELKFFKKVFTYKKHKNKNHASLFN